MLLCNTRLTLLPESAADNLGGDDTFAGHQQQGSADGGGVRQLMVLLAPAGDVTRLRKGGCWLRMPAGLQLEAAEPRPGKA